MSIVYCVQLAWSPEVLVDPCPECGGELIHVYHGWSTATEAIGLTDGGVCMECAVQVLCEPEDMPQQGS